MMTLRHALAALGLTIAACGETVQPTYSIQVVVPAAGSPLASATTVTVQVGSRPEVATSMNAHGVADLGLAPGGLAGAIRIRGYDANRTLVAYGQSPALEYYLVSRTVAVFVQTPGTFALLPVDSSAALPALTDHVALVAPAAATGGARESDGVLYGLGRQSAIGDGGRSIVIPSDNLYVFDPVSLAVVTRSHFSIPARAGVTAATRPNNALILFGGLVDASDPTMPPAPIGMLERVRFTRSGFSFDIGADDAVAPTSQDATIARGRAPLVNAGSLAYAFGGTTNDVDALATIVAIDPSQSDTAKMMSLVPVSLAAARSGHTATAYQSLVGSDLFTSVLVFGGTTDPLAPVAEIFSPPATVRAAGAASPALTPRRNHAAAVLPGGQIILIAGETLEAKPTALGDAVIYTPETDSFAPAPWQLATPRTRAVAFVVGTDLVVMGGRSADSNAPFETAEVFDASVFPPTPRGVIPALGRVGATASVLSNDMAVILGGQEVVKEPEVAPPEGQVELRPSAAIEIYQPRRGP